MTDEERFSNGELHRLIVGIGADVKAIRAEQRESVEAIRREAKEDRHALSTDLQSMLGQHIELRSRVNAQDREIRDLKDDVGALDDRVRDVVKNAAVVTGGISVLGFLASLWPWGKH